MQKFKKHIKNSDKFRWGQNDVEHHSDSLHEFKLAKDAPGNLANPKKDHVQIPNHKKVLLHTKTFMNMPTVFLIMKRMQ